MYHLYLIRAGKENSECFFPVFLFEDLIKRVSARLEAEKGPETKQEHDRQSGIAVHPVVEYYHCSYHVHVTWGTLHNISYPIYPGTDYYNFRLGHGWDGPSRLQQVGGTPNFTLRRVWRCSAP